MKRKNSRRRSCLHLICVLTVTAILFTYVVTVFLSGQEAVFAKQKAAALQRTFTAQLGDNVFKLTEEEYILGHMAAALPPEAEEEAMKALAVVLRTQLRRQQTGQQSASAAASGAAALALQTETVPVSAAPAPTASIMESAASPSSTEAGIVQISPSAYMEEYMRACLWGMERYMLFQEKAKTAIQATAGQVLCDENGAYIEAAYHGISAGTTRNGGEDYPYLRPKESRSDVSSAQYLTMYWFDMEQLSDLFPEVSEEQWAQIMTVEETDSLYIKEVELGEQLLTGEEFRSRLSLCAAAFSAVWQGDGLQIICLGKGHGFGLSCCGAEAQAAAGSGYAEILSYYYENTALINE